jgi:hypothetical protein
VGNYKEGCWKAGDGMRIKGELYDLHKFRAPKQLGRAVSECQSECIVNSACALPSASTIQDIPSLTFYIRHSLTLFYAGDRSCC